MTHVRQCPCKMCDAMLTLVFRRKPSVSRLLKEAELVGYRVCEFAAMCDGVIFLCSDECVEAYEKSLDDGPVDDHAPTEETTTT